MNDNAIITYNGIEIYNTDIDRITDEYINTYGIEPELLYKTSAFISLLSYIRVNLFKNVITKNNGVNNNGYDYSLLDEIHQLIFQPLCAKWNHSPSLLNFCQLTGISNAYLTEVMSGTYTNGGRVNPKNTETVKKWRELSEAANLEEISKGNVGAIFIGKANFGMQEQPQQLQIVSDAPRQTPEQIAAKYAGAKLPEPPVIEID